MNCPLILYPAETVGTVQFYAPCECLKPCDFAKCKYFKKGFLVQFQAIGATSTDTVSIVGKVCGGSFPLVTESTGALLLNSGITAGTVYKVVPSIVDGILRGVVQGL